MEILRPEIIKETPPAICDNCTLSLHNQIESMACQLCPFVLVDIKGNCRICNKPFVYENIPRGNIDTYVFCPEHKKLFDEFRENKQKNKNNYIEKPVE